MYMLAVFSILIKNIFNLIYNLEILMICRKKFSKRLKVRAYY
jgi:hypothetical protein